MKILLLGDVSGVHKNLQKGLFECGINKTFLATDGDGFKQIKGDIQLPRLNNNKIINKLILRRDFIKNILNIKDYDIVQIGGPFRLPFPLFPYEFLLKKLKKNNGKVFLSACGSDSYYWKFGKERLGYGPFQDVVKYDLKGRKAKQAKWNAYKFNQYLAENVDGVIPVCYEYYISYKHCKNIRPLIPHPLHLNNLEPQEREFDYPVKIFHGLSRYGLKGTRHIKKAFEIIKSNYHDKVDISIEGNLPFNSYLKKIMQKDFLIDQCYSYSYGVNALYGMALKKLVFSGAEKEVNKIMKVKNIPIENITPNHEIIVEKISKYIEKPKLIKEISDQGRTYVIKNHNAPMIAEKYLNEWAN